MEALCLLYSVKIIVAGIQGQPAMCCVKDGRLKKSICISGKLSSRSNLKYES